MKRQLMLCSAVALSVICSTAWASDISDMEDLMGCRMRSSHGNNGKRVVALTSVSYSKPFAQQGFRPGALIKEVNGARVKKPLDLAMRIMRVARHGGGWVRLKGKRSINESLDYHRVNVPRLDAGYCGDDNINFNSGEECDNYNLGGETCYSLGYDGGTLDCDAHCRFNTSDCYYDNAYCGDSHIDPGEECDGNKLDGANCYSLGYDGGTLSCDYDCRYDTGHCYHQPGFCGNNQIDPGEQCDRNILNGATCHSQGYNGGTLYCYSDCTYNTSSCFGQPDESCRNFGNNPSMDEKKDLRASLQSIRQAADAVILDVNGFQDSAAKIKELRNTIARYQSELYDNLTCLRIGDQKDDINRRMVEFLNVANREGVPWWIMNRSIQELKDRIESYMNAGGVIRSYRY